MSDVKARLSKALQISMREPEFSPERLRVSAQNWTLCERKSVADDFLELAYQRQAEAKHYIACAVAVLPYDATVEVEEVR